MTYSDELVERVALALVNDVRTYVDYAPLTDLNNVMDPDIYRGQARAALDAASVGEMLEALRPIHDIAKHRCAPDLERDDEDNVVDVLNIGDLRRVLAVIDKAEGRG